MNAKSDWVKTRIPKSVDSALWDAFAKRVPMDLSWDLRSLKNVESVEWNI